MSSAADNTEKPTRRARLLRRGEQAIIAVAVFLGLAALTWYWAERALRRNDLIEIDRAPPLTAKFVVDINHADWPEIMQLPGVGETTARQIVAERQAGGPFANLEEVARRVHGIGPKMIERMRPYVAAAPSPVEPQATTVR